VADADRLQRRAEQIARYPAKSSIGATMAPRATLPSSSALDDRVTAVLEWDASRIAFSVMAGACNASPRPMPTNSTAVFTKIDEIVETSSRNKTVIGSRQLQAMGRTLQDVSIPDKMLKIRVRPAAANRKPSPLEKRKHGARQRITNPHKITANNLVNSWTTIATKYMEDIKTATDIKISILGRDLLIVETPIRIFSSSVTWIKLDFSQIKLFRPRVHQGSSGIMETRYIRSHLLPL
jgi:hypothetical protein